jgi:protein-S-isoprenylcysteine O-methyltransferase Ste14
LNLQKIFLYISFFWVLSEIILAIVKRDKSAKSGKLDKSSLVILWLAICGSIFLGSYFGVRGIGRVALYGNWLSGTGIILIVLGLIIRWVAILSLRRYFTVNISIQEGHRIIDTGIYRFVRHPAYSVSLLSFLGLGMSFSNWLSVSIIFLPITIAFIYRIHYEEKALIQAFGEEYLKYSKFTWRLAPGVY